MLVQRVQHSGLNQTSPVLEVVISDRRWSRSTRTRPTARGRCWMAVPSCREPSDGQAAVLSRCQQTDTERAWWPLYQWRRRGLHCQGTTRVDWCWRLAPSTTNPRNDRRAPLAAAKSPLAAPCLFQRSSPLCQGSCARAAKVSSNTCRSDVTVLRLRDLTVFQVGKVYIFSRGIYIIHGASPVIEL